MAQGPVQVKLTRELKTFELYLDLRAGQIVVEVDDPFMRIEMSPEEAQRFGEALILSVESLRQARHLMRW